MNKQELFELFKEPFGLASYNDLLIHGPARMFECCYEDECSVKQNKEPIWTPNIGDDDTDIMIVAEAPSGTGGFGPHIGGHFGDNSSTNKKDEGLYAIREFVKDFIDKENKRIPYFTDLIKCGVGRQNREEKRILRGKRLQNCPKRFLLKEIGIIRPSKIVCVGNMARDFLKECQQNGEIKKNIKLIPLMHYSSLASLNLSSEDKKNIIWKWQAGSSLERKQILTLRLQELSFFQGE